MREKSRKELFTIKSGLLSSYPIHIKEIGFQAGKYKQILGMKKKKKPQS